MLSFLRDQGFENLPAQKSAAAAEKTPDNGNEKPQEQEYLTVAAREKQVRKSTILLAVVFVIGLLCLWFMIKKSTPKTASAEAGNTEETQIEIAIARLTGVKTEMLSRLDEIVKKFYEFSNVPQVRVKELVKNPFELARFSPDLDPNPDADERTLEMDTEMQLKSIMQSEQGNCCMIDDKKLHEGDSIKGFKVCKIDINDSLVKLESNGVEIILKLIK